MKKIISITILIILGLAFFCLPFGPKWFISAVEALSVSYRGGDSSYPHPFVQPLNATHWDATITNNEEIAISGFLYAEYTEGHFSQVDPRDWTKIADGRLRYGYNLARGESKTIRWIGVLRDRCPDPTDSTTSYVRNGVGQELGRDTLRPLSRVYLTMRNDTTDTITINSFVNGQTLYTGTVLGPGSQLRVDVHRGGVNDSYLFDCSRSPSYSFNVTGVPGASYTCSVVNNGLVNNCTAEHTAICTKTTGPTPGVTPTVTQPPPAGSCPDYAPWCTNPTNCTNNGCTVYDTPYGACATSGDICCGCPNVSSSRIGVNIKGTSHEVGSQVVVEVYQEPANSGSSACYYDGIDVNVNNPGGTLLPPDFTVCRATNFKDSGASNSCNWKPSGAGGSGRCRTCIWDTNNIQAAPDGRAKDFPVRQYPTEPSGYYIAGVYYGGHSDPGCNDSPGSSSDDTTLFGESNIWVDPTGDCPDGTSKQEVNISAYVDTAFNSLKGWTTLSGQPSIMNTYSNCCFRSRGECDPWGHCGDIQPYNGTNFVTYKLQCSVSPYAIRTRIPIPEENIGKEYIASVMGTGVKAAHPDSSQDGVSRPNMRLVSGDLTTKNYQFAGDCSWQEGAYKMVARDTWLDIYLISKTIRTTHTVHPPQAAFDNLRLYLCSSPPSCRISGNLTASAGEETEFCVTAESADTGNEIWYAPLGSNLSLGSSWTNIRPKTVGNGCGTVTFLQSGTYHVTCNAYSSSAGACTGNPGCPWGTHPYPGFTCAGWSDCTSNDSMVVTVTAPNAWYQTQGGNVYGQAVTTSIPSVAANRYFSLSSSWADSGLVSSSSKEPEPSDFSGAQVSQTDADWRAQGDLSTIANRYTYQYFASLLDINEANEEVSFRQEEVLANPGSLEENIIVYSGDNMTIGNPYWVINNQKIITFIDGDLTINEPISIVGNGFLALIVNGNLTVDIGTTPESTSPVLQGVYIVNGAVIIPERETEPKFVGEGIFFARGGFSLEKDLGDANAFYPAELFIFNPRYLFTAPKMIRYAPQLWQELAP